MNQNRCRGLTLVEIVIAVVILSIIATALIQNLNTTYRGIRQERDRAFAFAKAQAILTEVQAFAESASDTAATDLDDLDDAHERIPTLTISRDAGSLVAPDHPLSNNTQRNGAWTWSRTIRITPFHGIDNRNMRYVNVRIWKIDADGNYSVRADVSTVVSTTTIVFPSSQTFDIYFLNVENIPGWWVMMESIAPFAGAVLTELESQNPGLTFRTHWIRKASYGRNAAYRPYVNVAQDSEQGLPEAYVYPGLMPSGSASTYYYPPQRFHGRVSFDGAERNGYDATTNPHPYALADFYNHAMRYPAEKRMHDLRVGAAEQRRSDILAAKASGATPPAELLDMSTEPTLRLFLEDLNSNPAKYRHALIVNLHGELVPFPALRNYSDPAKLPDVLPEVRVVAHPEELRTHRDPADTNTDPVQLRVYGYVTNPTHYSGTTLMPADKPIQIQVMDVDLTDGAGGLHAGVAIKNLAGGVPDEDDDDDDLFPYSSFANSKKIGDPSLGNEDMYYDVRFVDPGANQQKFTLIELYRTPVVATQVGTRGLYPNKRSRLYGLEYVPSCTEAAKDFSRDLATSGDGPKNTARWRITIPPAVFTASRFVDSLGNYHKPPGDVVLTFRTRIKNPALADPLTGGVMFPSPVDPDNLSETYTWWASSREAVPWTERSQFQGDPRHNPYKDLCDGDPDFPNGYNWYHSSLNDGGESSSTDYPGLRAASLATRWDGRMCIDVPRFYELMRRGVVSSNGVFSTLTGWSFYYLGIGNEIGADSKNGYASSIPVELQPWGNATATGHVNNINSGRQYIRAATTSPYMWWGIPWLGELYPDSAYTSDWLANDAGGKPRGNLQAGSTTGRFHRSPAHVVYGHASSDYKAYGTSLQKIEARTGSRGCTSFMNTGTPTATFCHTGANESVPINAIGQQLVLNYGLAIPSTIHVNRPFSLSANLGTASPEFLHTPYSTERYSASIHSSFLDNVTSGWSSSGLIELTNPGNTSAGYIFVNGVSEAATLGTGLIAKYCIVGALHSYFEIGASMSANRPELLPRVAISSPTVVQEIIDPTHIDIQYDIGWTRWDENKYTDSIANNFAEDEGKLVYAVIYSDDNGFTWKYVQDDTPATFGKKPANMVHEVRDVNVGAPETYRLNTPSTAFPQGRYILRVEVHRDGQNQHYSWHQTYVFIQRT